MQKPPIRMSAGATLPGKVEGLHAIHQLGIALQCLTQRAKALDNGTAPTCTEQNADSEFDGSPTALARLLAEKLVEWAAELAHLRSTSTSYTQRRLARLCS